MNYFFDSSFSQVDPEKEKLMQEQVANSFNYVHKADLNRASMTILLNGISLIQNDTLLLYDSTPFASKGHLAMIVPCDPKQPNKPMFQVLIGLAPSLFPMSLGYIEQASNPPRSCLYHGQFGFGDPVTDVALAYSGEQEVSFAGPHSVVITVHESFIPNVELFMEKQHLAP
jgi:hypothetical protein